MSGTILEGERIGYYAFGGLNPRSLDRLTEELPVAFSYSTLNVENQGTTTALWSDNETTA
jgi:hypothetical protein